MVEQYRNFCPAKQYGEVSVNYQVYYRLKYNGDFEGLIDVGTLTGVILAETSLRETVQREETLIKRSRTMQKVENTEDGKKQLHQWCEELEDLRRKHSRQSLELYEMESRLPATILKQNYDSLRQNPIWYLREELVKDCSARNGCCSRSCGCCKTRYSTAERGRGIGHCTVECGCCSISRGFDYTVLEKKEIADQFTRMLWFKKPGYLLQIAEGYFWEIKPQLTQHKKKK